MKLSLGFIYYIAARLAQHWMIARTRNNLYEVKSWVPILYSGAFGSALDDS